MIIPLHKMKFGNFQLFLFSNEWDDEHGGFISYFTKDEEEEVCFWEYCLFQLCFSFPYLLLGIRE